MVEQAQAALAVRAGGSVVAPLHLLDEGEHGDGVAPLGRERHAEEVPHLGHGQH